MLRLVLPTASALALLILVVPTQAADEPVRRAPTQGVRAKSLLGARVYLTGNVSAGTVDDVVLTAEGVVDYLIVAQDGKLVTVPWDAVRFDYEKRAATVNITRERWQKVPTYTVDRYPTFYTPEYRGEVYRYYGLKPDQVRRLERRLRP